MRFQMADLPPDLRYKIMASSVTPRPIAWITTLSAAGARNCAPFSFFNAMGGNPPTVVIGMLRRPDGSDKDTAANIRETGEFVVNLVGEWDAEAMNLTCIDAPPGFDEIEFAKIETALSSSVRPPRIATAPVSLECRVHTIVEPGERQMITIGQVQTAHIRDEFILDAERLHLNTPAMRLIGRMHGAGWYARTTDLFHMERPSWAALQAASRD